MYISLHDRFSGICDEVNYDADFPSRCKDILRAVHVRDYRQGRSKVGTANLAFLLCFM